MRDIFDALLDHFGPQHWWPGDSPFEKAVGAILTQNTSWQNVARAIENLKKANVLEPHAIDRLPSAELAELIRPAGYVRLKAKRLKNFAHWLVEQFDGSMDAMAATSVSTLREELLSINGIGAETADSILLYAAGKPTFVVDAYTHRIAVRHGWIEPEAGYDDLKEHFESRLPDDVATFNELHALLVRVGKNFCRRSEARCDACPLKPFLPDGGPIKPGDY
jgi:endonuclease-3 related protein